MTDTDSSSKKAYVVEFDGEATSYPKWKTKFSAAVRMNGYWGILKGTDVPPKESDTLADTDTELLKLRKAHEKAYAHLILAQLSDAALNVVTLATSTDQPDGDAKIAWEDLDKKYLPQDEASKMIMRNNFLAMKLDSVNTNPKEWIAEVEKQALLMEKSGMTISDTEKKLLILNGMPEAYKGTVDILLSQTNTTTEVSTALELKFKRLNKGHSPKKGNDMALNAQEGKHFNGKCLNCGKRGHKAIDCWAKGNGNQNRGGPKRYPGKCNYCGILGHKENDCRKKKRESGDSANTAAGTTTEDVVLMAYCMEAESDDEDDMPMLMERTNDMSDDESDEEDDLALDEDDLEDDEEDDLAFIENESKVDEEEVAMMADTSPTNGETSKMTNETWLADTGATSHMKMNTDGVLDLKALTNHNITFGNKDKLKATHSGYYPVIAQNGKTIKLEVVIVPGLWVNLFSVTKAMKGDWDVSTTTDPQTKTKILQISKDSLTIRFNKVIPVGNDKQLIGIDFQQPKTAPTSTAVPMTVGAIIKHMAMHNRLGHPGDRVMKATAAKLGLKITGKFENCENCALAKIRQTSVNKRRHNKITKAGLCLAFDISSVKNASAGKAMHWLLFVDEATDMCFSFFLNTKDQLSEHGISLIQDLRGKHKKRVTHLCCDNAGENTDFQKRCHKLKLNFNFIYTAPGTPQQNGQVERKFPTLFGQVCAMLNLGGFPERLRHLLWAECANTATKLENIMVDSADETSR